MSNNIPLKDKKCLACDSNTKPLGHEVINIYMSQLKSPWQIVDDKKIEETFIFDNFQQALSFVNGVAKLAEQESHHPDIAIYYNQVKITLWTHKINGLSENDFILAAKIENLNPVH